MLDRARLVVDVQAAVQLLERQPGGAGQHLADLGDAAVEGSRLGVDLDPVARGQQHRFADVLAGKQVMQHLRHVFGAHGGALEKLR